MGLRLGYVARALSAGVAGVPTRTTGAAALVGSLHHTHGTRQGAEGPNPMAARTLFSRAGGGPEVPNMQSRSALNMGVRIIPERTAMVVERFGRFNRVLPSGIHVLIPLVRGLSLNPSM
jgi:hypothetical protein